MTRFGDLFGRRRQSASDAPAADARSGDVAPAEFDYADREDYKEPPVLTLRSWDYGAGLETTTAGYGFTTLDGRIWPAGNCHWRTWRDLGVLVINVVGEQYHADDLVDPSFDPGQPLRLVAEPDNPHDSKAIAVRNWTGDRTAGYVKKGSTTRLRNMVRDADLRVMALSCRYDRPQPSGRRESIKVVLFRPGRLLGADHIERHPPID